MIDLLIFIGVVIMIYGGVIVFGYAHRLEYEHWQDYGEWITPWGRRLSIWRGWNT